MNEDCIFCRIVAGKLPSSRVYEDDSTLAFLDINPVEKGHTLVIPKAHHDPLTAVPPELLQKVILSVQKVARGVFAATNADGMNINQANGKSAGQVIPHVHFHLIPRFDRDEPHRNWAPGKYSSQDEMAACAAAIADRIKKQE